MNDKVDAAFRAAFEKWMVEDRKCIVGSSDPYPAGMERDNWRAWLAARTAIEQLAGGVEAVPVAWGVYGLVAGEWVLQHPVRFTKRDAENDCKIYTDPSSMRVGPLFDAPPATVPKAEHDKALATVGELEAALSILIDTASQCDGWASFPRNALESAEATLSARPTR